MRRLICLVALSAAGCLGTVTDATPSGGAGGGNAAGGGATAAGGGEATGGGDTGGGGEAVGGGAAVEDAGAPDAGAPDAGEPDAGPPDAGPPDAGPPDAGFCNGARLCEQFDSYTAGALSNGMTLGPWRVSVRDNKGSATIDTARSFSGGKSLKVHIDQAASSGGQLRTRNAALFGTGAPKLYGRFMLYMGADGHSVHWTMFGAAGTVPPGSAAAGHHATYLYSAFERNGSNSFGDVFYDDQTAQDCWNNSTQLIPKDRWACVAWAVDGSAMTYRFWLDGQPVPSMSVNTTGQGCVAHPANSPWYGPVFDEFYVGALSFHPMTAPLDLWIDDLIVDTAPVSCP